MAAAFELEMKIQEHDEDRTLAFHLAADHNPDRGHALGPPTAEQGKGSV